MLSFAYKRFDGRVPEPGDPSSSSGQGLDDEDRALLEKVEAGLQTVGDLPQGCLPLSRGAGRSAGPAKSATPLARVAREANGYRATHPRKGVDRKPPWFQIKEDKAAAATTVYVTQRVRAVDNLKTILAPTLCVPHTAQRLHEYLATHPRKGVGYDGQLFGTQHVVEYEEETRSHRALTYDHTGAIGTWAKSELPPGQALRQPAPLFKKLDQSVIEEEYARLEG
jgi:methionyl-tRNA synthetase